MGTEVMQRLRILHQMSTLNLSFNMLYEVEAERDFNHASNCAAVESRICAGAGASLRISVLLTMARQCR